MKKFAIIIIISFIWLNVLNAQAIKTGAQAINTGLGFFGTYTGEDGLPALNFSYEILPIVKLGIGYIGVGGYGSYKYTNENDINYNYWIVGGRATYHLDFYEMNHLDFFNDFDVYAGVFGGIVYEDIVKPRTDIFAGCRYKFTENIGVFTETSTGISSISFGLSFIF